MYFPYLRGKQYELLALRELIDLPLDSDKIIPIIEPVKSNLSSLRTALKAISKIGVKVQLILNPEVGDFKNNPSPILPLVHEFVQAENNPIIPTYIVKADKDVDFIRTSIFANDFAASGYALVHLNKIGRIEELSELTKTTTCLYNTINVNHLFALRKKFDNRALLSDYFNKQRVNVDYISIPEEVFSSDYAYYQEENCVAFSDYQAIGSGYSDSGGAAYAVAIHLTYKEQGSEDIRIAHFVSNSNDDQTDPGGKFFEALQKLIDFIDARKISDTTALRKFRECYDRQAFPGLGVVKKLSIMHHIELIQSLI